VDELSADKLSAQKYKIKQSLDTFTCLPCVLGFSKVTAFILVEVAFALLVASAILVVVVLAWLVLALFVDSGE
jgi:hypothetical protein